MRNLSIKKVPDTVVEKLHLRAARHRRSLQGELMEIVCRAAEADQTSGLASRCRTWWPLPDASAIGRRLQRIAAVLFDEPNQDAAYLQLAIELNAPLATLDRRLGEVAVRILANQ